MHLTSERLRLRPWTTGDLDALHQLWSDPETSWWGAHVSLDQTRDLLQNLTREGGWWAVEYGNSSKPPSLPTTLAQPRW